VAPRLPVLREDWPHHRTGVKFRTASSVQDSLEEKTHSTSKSAFGYRFMNTRPSRSPLPRSSGVPAQDKRRAPKGGPYCYDTTPRHAAPHSTKLNRAASCSVHLGMGRLLYKLVAPCGPSSAGPRPRRLVPYGLHHSHPIDRKQHEPDQGGDAHGEQDLLMPLGHCDTVRRRSFS
jgi:hypothetical protein